MHAINQNSVALCLQIFIIIIMIIIGGFGVNNI